MRVRAAAVAFLLAISPARGAEWKILPGGALTFSGVQTGQPFAGRFARFDARVSLDPDKLDVAKIVATIDIASAATGDRQRDAALSAKEWFDAAGFPQARFESRQVKKTASGYEASGDLTLRGVTKPIVLPFTLEIEGRKAHAKGHVSLKRDLFGVGQGEWASGDWVGLDVAVDFDLTAERAD
jgi:polyisoprenoid-binding protein YceI